MMEVWVNIHDDGSMYAYLSEEEADRFSNIRRERCVHVREVPPNDGWIYTDERKPEKEDGKPYINAKGCVQVLTHDERVQLCGVSSVDSKKHRAWRRLPIPCPPKEPPHPLQGLADELYHLSKVDSNGHALAITRDSLREWGDKISEVLKEHL